MIEKSLKINFLWAFVGNSTAAFCLWLLIVILTKKAPVETVGLFGLAQAIALPISMLFSLKLQLANVTDARNEYAFGDYIAVKILTSLATSVTIGLVGILFYPPGTAAAILVLGIGYAISEVREYFLSIMQKYGRMDLMALSRIVQGIVSLLLFGGLFWLTQNLVASILGLVATRLIILFSYDIRTSAKLATSHFGAKFEGFRPNWDWAKMMKLVRLTAPLGLVAWLTTLLTSIPRIVMEIVSGRESVGYFTAISSLLAVGSMIIVALGQTVNPRLARYYFEDQNKFWALLFKFFSFNFIIGLCLIMTALLFGGPILDFLFTPDYAKHKNVFVYIAIAGCILFVFHSVNSALSATRQFFIQVPIYTIAMLSCIIFSLVLIPRYDMVGAAWSLALCYAVGSAGCLPFVIKLLIRIRE